MTEQGIRVAQVDQDQSSQQLGSAFSAEADRALKPEAIEFKKYNGQFFNAEYQLVDRNLVFHFFVHPMHAQQVPPQQLEHWWLNGFAQVLDQTAQDYFQATIPQLQARYTEEVASWFLKAQGFSDLLDPLGFAAGFLARLDGTLLASSGRQAASEGAMG